VIILIKNSLLKLPQAPSIIHLENSTIYLNNIQKINKITATESIIQTASFRITLFGTNLRVLKMLDGELLLEGNITKIEKQANH